MTALLLATTTYKIMLLLHVLSAVVVFGVGFAQPMVARTSPDSGAAFAKFGTYVQAPALLVLVGAGTAMLAVAKNDTGVEYMKQAWVSVAFVAWLVAAVAVFLAVRAYRKAANAAPFVGIMHLALVVGLWAMIFQPGLDAVVK